ncbi:ATP-dependent endonuclease [Thioalkalivibrio sp. ALJ1]|uniref:ATP-dependent nuclease n=1 Tax=Thioalkalivibrio sp. ALJ1 TaxID=1158144 RepID=UPI0009DCEA90|nr:AAA family ATPase [Thioalkalivibrio sp. ALJ1]
MYYKSFRIKNFKGIKDTKVGLTRNGSTSVFSFVGLNESGKTTILEAIHSFLPDTETKDLIGQANRGIGPSVADQVPKHLLSNFSDEISVTAALGMSNDEKGALIADIKQRGLVVDIDSFPDEIEVKRVHRFEKGDHQQSAILLETGFSVKTGRQKNWRQPNAEERKLILQHMHKRMPGIAYFPTFVFDFPKKIFLTREDAGKVNQFYRKVFQDILDYDGKGDTIEGSIVRRIRSDENVGDWTDFLPSWHSGDDKAKIQHVMDRAGSVVTQVVFGRWNQIFGEDPKGKEVNISFEPVEGQVRDETGKITKTGEHDLYIEFQIKDGTRRFSVNDRSLGFRWFFSFMLFTQFRVARENSRPVFFLFDEPASNLHAAAQQKLIESFPEVAKNENSLAYTTHSHYMVEPKWLEQTFIVTNRMDAPPESIVESAALSEEALDIRATPYRQFVNRNPGNTSYFQPILDRLEVVPSRFDMKQPSIVVEGRSDYYVLRYGSHLLEKDVCAILPGLGAGTLGALVALQVGWGLEMVFLLDGDSKGKTEKNRYVVDFGMSADRAATLDELLTGVCEIEDILDDEAEGRIAEALALDGRPNKKHVRRFFQERLAREDVVDLGAHFRARIAAVFATLEERLAIT